MLRRDDLFLERGLVAPPMSPAMKELYETLILRNRHPVAMRRGWCKRRQWWLLHRSLAYQPAVILELLREFIVDTADPEQVIPLPNEFRPLVRVCWQVWVEMADSGVKVDYEGEPQQPLPPNCRRRNNVLRSDLDEDEGDDWRR